MHHPQAGKEGEKREIYRTIYSLYCIILLCIRMHDDASFKHKNRAIETEAQRHGEGRQSPKSLLFVRLSAWFAQ
jgi:hypothetical protein